MEVTTTAVNRAPTTPTMTDSNGSSTPTHQQSPARLAQSPKQQAKHHQTTTGGQHDSKVPMLPSVLDMSGPQASITIREFSEDVWRRRAYLFRVPDRITAVDIIAALRRTHAEFRNAAVGVELTNDKWPRSALLTFSSIALKNIALSQPLVVTHDQPRLNFTLTLHDDPLCEAVEQINPQLDQLVADGLITTAFKSVLIQRLFCVKTEDVSKMRDSIRRIFESLRRNICTDLSCDWLSVSRQSDRFITSLMPSNGVSDLDKLFGCLWKQTTTPACKFGSGCWTPLCLFLHSQDSAAFVYRGSSEFFQVMATFLMSVGRLRCNALLKKEVITQEHMKKALSDVMEVTSPKSQMNRLEEMICYVSLTKEQPAIAVIAFKSLGTIGFESNNDDDSDIINVFVLGDSDILNDNEARRIVLRELVIEKIIKRCQQVNQYEDILKKSFLLKTHTGLGIGDVGRETLVEELSNWNSSFSKPQEQTTIFDLLLAYKVLGNNFLKIGNKLKKKANEATDKAKEWLDNIEHILFAFLVEHHELNLIPANSYSYERECPIIEIKVLRALKQFVQTERTQAEGGLRSCLEQLSKAKYLSKYPIVRSQVRLLHLLANIRAHHGVINIPLYLSFFAHLLISLLSLPNLLQVNSSSTAPASEPNVDRKAMQDIVQKIRRRLLWDFENTELHALVPEEKEREITPEVATVTPGDDDVLPGFDKLSIVPMLKKD